MVDGTIGTPHFLTDRMDVRACEGMPVTLIELRGDRHAARTNARIPILLVSDDESDWLRLRRLFATPPLAAYELSRMRHRKPAFEALLSGGYAAALVDHDLARGAGIELIRNARVAGARTPMIVLTGVVDRTVDDRAVSAGAVDSLVKDLIDTRDLARALRYALAEAAARDQLLRAQDGIAAVEQVGRLLASEGPTPEALEVVMDVLHDQLGYQLPSIYLGDTELVRLGAQRGYSRPLLSIGRDSGVVGRVMRSGALEFLPMVADDPDFLRAEEGAHAEICAPLLVDGEFLGILNIESTAERPLDRTDVNLVASIADRLAVAIVLGRERLRIAERAAMLARLNEFSTLVNGTLERDDLTRRVLDALATIFRGVMVAITLREPDGAYRIRAVRGGHASLVGVEVVPGEGAGGRAIRDRAIVVFDRIDLADYPAAVREAEAANPTLLPSYALAAAPLLRGEDVLGAITVGRGIESPYSALEQEGLLLAAGQIALAFANAELHAAVAELALRDGLTGLHNRRYFDEMYALRLAARERLPRRKRVTVAAIMFDLDDFGQLNKAHGHRLGDDVLRTFARILRARFRSTDLVVRYGGEEFVVILDGATAEDAERLANEVRETLIGQPIEVSDGSPLVTTVSAGCAALADGDTSGEALLALADVGLTLAKRSGRNRVVRV